MKDERERTAGEEPENSAQEQETGTQIPENSTQTPETIEIPEQVEEVDTSFMQEEIKTPPVSRRQLLRRMGELAFIGAVFGTVACIFFVLIEPLMNHLLYPQEETVQEVILPEETAQEELTPEEMQEKDREKEEQLLREEIDRVLSQTPMDATEYQRVYGGLQALARERSSSLATVTAISAEGDWLDVENRRRSGAVGIVVGKSSKRIRVAVLRQNLSADDKIEVQFAGGVMASGEILGKDAQTGIAVLGVSTEDMTKEELAGITAAPIHEGPAEELAGQPVIAVGSPAGAQSVSFGVITGASGTLPLYDASYVQITTDIYGSTGASGFLLDLDGRFVGIIDMAHRRSDMPNSLTAIDLSQLKPLFTALSDGRVKAYLGVQAADVPPEIRKEQSMPEGVYVSGLAADSPAMNSALQKGDLISAVNDQQISDCAGLEQALYGVEAGQNVSLRIRRRNGNAYTDMTISLEAGAW